MKKLIPILTTIIFFVLLFVLSFKGSTQKPPQGYRVDKATGAIIAPEPQTKSNDKVYTIKNGITFYQGKRGGIYYFKTSREGKRYKVYIKKT